MFKIWADIRPAAVTLKSTTRMDRNEPWKTHSIKHKTLDTRESTLVYLNVR